MNHDFDLKLFDEIIAGKIDLGFSTDLVDFGDPSPWLALIFEPVAVALSAPISDSIQDQIRRADWRMN